MIDHPSQPNLDTWVSQPTWSFRFWLITAVTGAAAGLAGGLLMRLLRAVENLAWQLQEGSLLEAISATTAAHRILVLCVAGLLVSLSGRFIRKFLGNAGDVDSAIWFRSGQVPLSSTLAQAIESIVIVGMGASLGRESAIKQAGGAIASRLAQWSKLSRAEHRLLVASGVGAGMAAAYNVPLGGALFAIEVLLGSVSLRLVLPALLCSVIATTASWILLPTGPVYDVPEYPLSIPLTVWSLLAGPVLGLAAVLFVRAIAWAGAHKPATGTTVVGAPLGVFALLGLTATAFPELLGNGQDAVQIAFNAKFSIFLLLVLPPLKALATAGCLASGARGGLFTPSLLIGAILGGLLGHGWDAIWSGSSMGCCSVVGACAFLAAASQGPVSALVLVLELTRHVDATMAPMLLAVTGAMLVARHLGSVSIYSARIGSKNHHPELAARDQPCRFKELLSKDFVAVSAGTKCAEFLHQLALSTYHFPVYVVDHEGGLLGKIDRNSLEGVRHSPMPIDAATMADFVIPTDALDSQLSEQDVIKHLAGRQDSSVPIIDSATGRLIGVVHRRSAQ